MRHHYLNYLLTILCITTTITAQDTQQSDWVIIGAGPAGIATVGLLLDSGVSTDNLLWIDPQFDVGRLGAYYYNVPGNSKAHTYHYFIHQCSVFCEVQTESIQKLLAIDPNTEPILGTIIDPLRDITSYIISSGVPTHTGHISKLERSGSLWHLELDDTTSVDACNVILATGCHPRVLNYPGPQNISLDEALDQKKLAKLVTSDDTVAVVGSAHSAALMLMYLHELGIPTVHLYKYPFQYKYDMGAVNPTTIAGLQGVAAQWVYNVYENKLPETITRVHNTQENRAHWLPKCTKIIYAVGYVRNGIEGWSVDTLAYDSQSGVIEPHLYGVGLAFPEEVCDYDGTKNYAIGLIDFMKHGQRVVPQWIARHESSCSRTSRDDSFIITQL